MKLLQFDKLSRPQIIAIATAGILLAFVIVVGVVLPKNKQTPSVKSFKIVSTSKTSPDKKHAVSEETVDNNQLISIQDSSGNLVTNDLIAQNSNTIGYGTKFGCPCGTSFKGWVDNSTFVIEVTSSSGEKYQYLVDSGTGVVVGGSSVNESGGASSNEGTSGTGSEGGSSDDGPSEGSTSGGTSGGEGSSGGGSSGASGGGVSYPSNPATKPRIIP